MHLALLIEGASTFKKSGAEFFRTKMPNYGTRSKVHELIELSNSNYITPFDPTMGIDPFIIQSFLARTPTNKHPLYVYFILDFFRIPEIRDFYTLKMLIIPAYEAYLKEKTTSRPLIKHWLENLANLNNEDIEVKKSKLIKKYYKRELDRYKAYEEEKASVLELMFGLAKCLSAENLKLYLGENPQITRVIGYLSFAHSSLLDTMGIKTSALRFCNRGVYLLGERKIDITLFYDPLNCDDGFKAFKDSLEDALKCKPKNPQDSKKEAEFTSLFDELSKLTIQHDQKKLRSSSPTPLLISTNDKTEGSSIKKYSISN